MTEAAPPLRRLQKDHALILLTAHEYLALQERGSLAMPDRHREHFVKVMRRANTWQAIVGDGSGKISPAMVEKSTLLLTDRQREITLQRKARAVTLVQAWIKPKPLSLVLQKAAELGASHIHLIDCDRSQAMHEKTARIEAVVENACMQAYNPVRPHVTTGNLAAWLTAPQSEMLYGDLEAEARITDFSASAGSSLCFINGPEGGFSDAEIARLRQVARPVLLSENVLRSETAAIFALGYLCLQP